MKPSPCPFCGSDFVRATVKLGSLFLSGNEQCWGVSCGNCAAGGPPMGRSEEHAIVLWNRAGIRSQAKQPAAFSAGPPPSPPVHFATCDTVEAHLQAAFSRVWGRVDIYCSAYQLAKYTANVLCRGLDTPEAPEA